jgi:GNAT superfamily N-acetyltransferase
LRRFSPVSKSAQPGIPSVSRADRWSELPRWSQSRLAAKLGRSIFPIAKGHLMNPIEVAICRAAVDFADWEAVRTLIHDAFASMEGRIDPPSSALRLTPQSMAADAADGALLLAELGGTLVGCVFVRPKQDALYIGKLAVRPDLQGSGIGKALVAAARAEARALGLKALELQTRIELTENHAAFARMGFMKTAETAHRGYQRPTSITMRAPV